jgi:hypothetical protein
VPRRADLLIQKMYSCRYGHDLDVGCRTVAEAPDHQVMVQVIRWQTGPDTAPFSPAITLSHRLRYGHTGRQRTPTSHIPIHESKNERDRITFTAKKSSRFGRAAMRLIPGAQVVGRTMPAFLKPAMTSSIQASSYQYFAMPTQTSKASGRIDVICLNVRIASECCPT